MQSTYHLDYSSAVQAPARTISGRFVWLLGVLLPLAAITFEISTAVCTNFIDPMPAPAYVALLFAVPLCNAIAWCALKRDALAYSRWFAAAAGFSISVALFYTVLFAWILPFCLIGVIVLLPGLGLAPIASLATAIRLGLAWKGFTGWRPVVWGAIAGTVALVVLAAPAIGLRAGAQLAGSEQGWIRDAGFSILRTDAVSQELLQSCEFNDGTDARNAIALLTGRGALTVDESRSLYYRATGQSYDQQPISHWKRRAFLQFDEQRGGDRVGRVSADVQLTTSQLDSRIDPRGATSYTEWTMNFHNSAATQQEARTEVALPPGSVVSRVTLWVNGEEREAAYGGSGQVRQAYESVVRVRRDPLLVTSAGRDRVLVQCFPIQPAGDMKIRLGVTAPILPDGVSDRGFVTFPSIVSSNFGSREASWLWLESEKPIQATAGKFQASDRGATHVLRGAVKMSEPTIVQIAGLDWPATWTLDSAGGGAQAIEQRFTERAVEAPERVIVVLDGSSSTSALRQEITAALKTIPAGVQQQVLVATRSGVSGYLPEAPWSGGIDAAPALDEALSSAAGESGTAVGWIAGAQPVKMAAMPRASQAIQRSQGGVRLAVLATGGENVLLRDLNGLAGVEMIPRLGRPADDLRRYFRTWHVGTRERVVERRAVPADAVPAGAVRASSHVVRLWAAEQAARTAETDRGEAVKIASAHQIVTPWTGAVVLETLQQFQQNGLQPAQSGSTPSVTPEPRTWLLIGLGLLAVMAWRARSETRVR